MRRCALLLLLSALGTGFWSGVAARCAAADAPPNIVYLMTDDQRFDTLGCYGNSIIQTPNIDQLARDGVAFDNAFVTTSICVTSRASVYSGQYASRHGVWVFNVDMRPELLAQTYLSRLKDAGYRIGFIGKWGVGKPPQNFFDYNRGWPGQNRYIQKIVGQTRHLTSVMGDQALEFLDGCTPQQPFSLSISFKAPHVQDTANVQANPWPHDPVFDELYQDLQIPPPRLAQSKYFDRLPDFLKNSENRQRWAVRFWGPARYQSSVKGYYRLITGVDAVVGRIRDKLAQRGLADNTVIIFTSDHGYYLGDHGLAGKWHPHEVSIRVPLVVLDPRQSAEHRGVRYGQMALNIDMAPTMLDLAGLETPQAMQGRSLAPFLAGQEPADWRSEFFYEHMFVPQWEGMAPIPRSHAVRTESWKYIRYIDTDPLFEELYDLRSDPDEEHNLVDNAHHAEQLARLRAKCDQWRERVK